LPRTNYSKTSAFLRAVANVWQLNLAVVHSFGTWPATCRQAPVEPNRSSSCAEPEDAATPLPLIVNLQPTAAASPGGQQPTEPYADCCQQLQLCALLLTITVCAASAAASWMPLAPSGARHLHAVSRQAWAQAAATRAHATGDCRFIWCWPSAPRAIANLPSLLPGLGMCS
jgi:hypothetical protein